MVKLRRYPGISDVGSQEERFLDALETIGILIGERGDPLDRAITVRDLVDSGLSAAQIVGDFAALEEVPPGGKTPTEVTALTGLLATAGVAQITISWDGTNQRNYEYTEIWRHTSDNLANAVLHATTDAEVWSDAVGVASATFYYWVRGVSSSGAPGPFNATAGTSATTNQADADFIENLAVTTAKIALLGVDTAQIADGAITTAKIGNLQVGSAQVANTIQSNAYVAGTSGWQLDKLGDLEANDATFRGDLIAATFRTATTGQRIDINFTSANEIEFYGDRGDTTIELLLQLGINAVGGDNVILSSGNLNAGNSRLAGLFRSNTAAGIAAESISGYGALIETTSGIAALGLDLNGSTARAHLKMFQGPQSHTNLPTAVQDGEFYATTTDRLYMTAGGSWQLIGGGSFSQTANGYAMQNYGVIVQWGDVTSTVDTAQNFSFPLAFPNACRAISVNWLEAGPTAPITASTFTASQFTVDRNNAIDGNQSLSFIAVGY